MRKKLPRNDKKLKSKRTHEDAQNYEKFYVASSHLEYSNENGHLTSLLRDRTFTVSAADVTYRNITSWDEKGLLLSGPKDKMSWRKFSFIEICWLMLVRELRQAGVKTEKIKIIREQSFHLHNDYPNSEVPIEKINSSAFSFSVLKNIAGEDIVFVSDVHGNSTFTDTKDGLLKILSDKDNPATLITISLDKIVNEVFEKHNISKSLILEPVTKAEIEILEVIRACSPNSKVTLTLDEEKELSFSTVTSANQSPTRSIQDVKEIINKTTNGNVSIKMRDGKVVCIEEEKINRYNKSDR